MECLEGLVGIADMCAADPGALDLNIVGINETFLKNITGPEETPEKLLAQVRTWAAAYVKQDILKKFAPNLTASTLIDRVVLGDLTEGTAPSALPSTIGGIVVEVDAGRSFLELTLQRGIYYGTTNPLTVTVYDLKTGATVITASITDVNNTVNISLPVSGRQCYLIAHSATDYDYTTIGKGGCSSCRDTAFRQSGVVAYGARIGTSVPKKSSNLQSASHSSGLSLQMTLKCDQGEWLCSLGDDLALPMLYKTAQGCMDRALWAKDRLNNIVADPDLLIARAKQYAAEYDTMMDQTVKGITVPKGSNCFRCKPVVYSRVAIP